MIGSLVHALAHVLVPMFAIGMAGSAVVVVITLLDDFTDFLSDSGNEEHSGEGLN